MLCNILFGTSFVVLLGLFSNGQAIRIPESQFVRHKVVTPVLHHARTKRLITSTMDTNGMHHPEVTMKIDMDGQEHVLDLRINTDLVAGDYVIGYQKDGETVLYKPSIEELDICQYSGTVRDRKGSWAALSTCHGVRGIIHDGKQTRYIEPVGNNIDSTYYFYDHFDLKENLKFESDEDINKINVLDLIIKEDRRKEKNALSRHKRDSTIAEKIKLKGPFNSDQFSRYLEIVLVADNNLYKKHGENITNVHEYLKNIANIVHSLYAPLNIFVALVGVVVWNERDEIVIQANIDTVYTNFLHYRKNKLLFTIPNDNAQLVTSSIFENAVQNRAFQGTICTSSYSGGVNSDHKQAANILALFITHSIGHNLGLKHDDEDCLCEDEACIMNPIFSTRLITHWSSCSFLDLASNFDRGLDYCLRNKPKSLFGSSTCGNGFVESNEECDCGANATELCGRCYNIETCLMRSNATCAVGECCDPWTCQRKERGTICRTAANECDLPEYCDGNSGDCPDDVYKMDTTPCSNDTAYCVNGSCSSHTDRCQLLWGPTGKMSDAKCYISNIRGDVYGHCGYQTADPDNKSMYNPCDQQDMFCGLLQCEHESENLQFGMGWTAVLRVMFIFNKDSSSGKNVSKCNTANIDMGVPDVGLVPDGAKCGEEKMCLSQKCVSIAPIRENIAKLKNSVCPSNCSGHGVCNSKGHCHCDFGFIPPLCEPFFSGSIDSGPVLLLQPKDDE
ncbi:unnamed protein product, partial [Brenthis ino]